MTAAATKSRDQIAGPICRFFFTGTARLVEVDRIQNARQNFVRLLWLMKLVDVGGCYLHAQYAQAAALHCKAAASAASNRSS